MCSSRKNRKSKIRTDPHRNKVDPEKNHKVGIYYNFEKFLGC